MKSVKDTDKTNEQFPGELEELRRWVAELEALELKRRRTETELVQRNQQLLTIQAAVAAISSSLELEAVLNTVAGEMLNLLGATGCVIYENNALAGTIKIIFEAGPNAWRDDSYVGHVFQLADFPLTQQVLDKRQARQMTLDRPDIDPAELAYMQAFGFKTLLMLPMVFQERLVGLLEIVDERTARKFEAQEIALAQLLTNQAASALENSRLYAKTRRQLKEQTALREASAIISSTLDLKTVLTHMAEQVSRAIDSTSAYFGSYETERHTSTVLAEYYSPQASPQERVSDLDMTYHVPQDCPGTIAALQTGQPKIMQVDDPHLIENTRVHLKQFGAQSVLSIPLRLGDQILGFAELWESRRRREFTPAEIRLCQGIAQQAAIAIQNAQLFAGAQRRLKELTLLVDSSKAVSVALDVDTVLQVIARQVTKVMETEECAISIWDREQDVVVTLLDYVVEKEWAEPRGTAYPLHDYPVTRQVLTKNQPRLIQLNDPAVDPAELALLKQGELSSVLMVPLVVRDQVIGLLELMSVTERTYTDTEIGLCQTLANQMAAALENARLLEQVQRYANELEQRVAARTAELTRTNADLQTEIIERQQAEKKLTVARDQALAASCFKTELMAKVSHELRTPLSAILGLTELLMAGAYGPISDQQMETTAKILDSTHYLTKLVNELLSQAKLDAGHFSLKQEMFAPARMVEQVRSKMKVLAQDKALQLITDLAADVPGLICGDPDQVQQILVNLVSNAIKFTKQGTITISLYCPDPTHWALQVSDTGPGIPAEARSYIFEPFRQVDGSMTREHGGTGLGLSIVKQLTDLMDGQISLTSEVGRGSTFTVILPLIPA